MKKKAAKKTAKRKPAKKRAGSEELTLRTRPRKDIDAEKKRARARKKAAAKRAPAVSRAKKTKGGRPPFVPTAEQRKNVETLAGLGLRHEEICLLVENPTTGHGIDDETLRRHFSVELARGGPKLAAQVAQSIARKALGDGNQAVTAAIWFSKCRMGWKERVHVDVDVKSGVLVTPGTMSPEEWIKAAAAAAVGKTEPGAEED